MKSYTRLRLSRRSLLKWTGFFSLSAPIALYLGSSRFVRAADSPKLEENDPTAVALKYVHNATQAKDRKNSDAVCDICQHYTGGAGAEWGPCAIFPGKQVNAKGWCSVWVKKLVN